MSGEKMNMTDQQLSIALGRYQRIESIGMLLGILLVVGGIISAFVQHDALLCSVTVFSGVGLFILVAKPAQTKKKALMDAQLGTYFRAELETFFGPEPVPATLPIDDAYLRKLALLAFPWTECAVEHFHEGVHGNLHFSATNVELRRTVEERSGANCDNWMTRTETLFHGIVVRVQSIGDPTLDIALRDRFQERKKDADLMDAAQFREYFTARTAEGAAVDAQVTPALRALVKQLEAFANGGKLAALILRDGELTLAQNTHYVFAWVPEELDLRDIEGIRKWFTASLRGMAQLVDILKDSDALKAGANEAK